MLMDIELRLRPDGRAPGEARRSLEALRPTVDDTLVDDAELLVSEVVSNAVRHAGLDGTDSIELRVRGSRSALHVDVVDPGPGFDPANVSLPHARGGWGLWLLEQLAERWGVERGEVTTVWFELEPTQASIHGIRDRGRSDTRKKEEPWARRWTRPRVAPRKRPAI
jgi:anti-sigma regulatory factor (Ser/Thr protein kinase)